MAERTPPFPGHEVRWSIRRLAPEEPAAGPAPPRPLVLSPALRVGARSPDPRPPLLLSDLVVPPAPLVLTARVVGHPEPAPTVVPPGPTSATPAIADGGSSAPDAPVPQDPPLLRPDERAAPTPPAPAPPVPAPPPEPSPNAPRPVLPDVSLSTVAPPLGPDALVLAAPEPPVDPALRDLVARLVREEVRREFDILREELRATPRP